MLSVYSCVPHARREAGIPAIKRHKTDALPCRFVLSRCLGSSSYYSLWLLQGDCLLQHWLVLADGAGGLRQPSLFLIQSADRLLPSAHYDEGHWQYHPLEPDNEAETRPHTVRQALSKGCLSLQLEGSCLQGRYLLQRVGAGRGHTWQMMLMSKAIPQKA